MGTTAARNSRRAAGCAAPREHHGGGDLAASRALVVLGEDLGVGELERAPRLDFAYGKRAVERSAPVHHVAIDVGVFGGPVVRRQVGLEGFLGDLVFEMQAFAQVEICALVIFLI